ncbi:unnamed protein product [Sphagnum jensenii]|uniref:Cytochrome b n=1 Tax=Sphagnum jensenii TaxID=128206 RepID=A0ABP1A1R8_9BRYO
MSFWGATVITSLASAIPVVGDTIVTWLWGGFSVDNATLNRFFSPHYLLPFIIAGAAILHLAALHQYGSNNPLGINSSVDKIAFYPYFYVKDLVGWVAFAIFFSIFVFYAPNVLGHPDNYIPANPMSTPAHIVPEWYFLPVYAILRKKKRRFVDNQSFFKSLIATLPKWIHQFQKSKHENILYTNPDYLFQLLWFLKYHTNTRFQVLIDICGVDHPSRKRRFEVVYNLLRATAKSPNKVLICAKQMRRCRSLQRDGHDLSNRYTARDTQRDELPMENIACRERESQGIANPWAIPNRVFETQLNGEKNLFIYFFFICEREV